MTDKHGQVRPSPTRGGIGRTLLGLEQILYACVGYAVAQLPVILVVSDPGDGDYIVFGIAGAFIGVVLHVLVRGMGVRIPGLARRSPAGGETGPSRAAAYRSLVSVLRKASARKDRGPEPPGNRERIVESGNGFRVGNREFSSRSQAEDYLYVDSASGAGHGSRDKHSSASHQSAPLSARKAKLLNTIALATVVAVIALMVILTFP